jgi:cytochrome c oxidase cbb3-type subunit 3
LYELTCRSCHGVDLRGGDLGGPNLLRSPLVLNDRAGEQVLPVIRDGISTPGSAGMPPQPLSEDDARAVAEYIHSVLAAAPGQGAPPPGPPVLLDLLVGDARAGRAYFEARCASCHSAAGDLAGIGARIPDPKALQNTWVRGGPARGRGARPSARAEVRVTVTDPSGARTEGRLDRIDDFLVVLTQADGRQRSFTRRRDVPKVEVDDPLARHTELLSVYIDRDIHDVTAYLTTLR